MPFLALLAGCQICRIVLLAGGLLAAGWGVLVYREHEAAAHARAAAIAEMEKATAAESARRDQVIAAARAEADKAAQGLAQKDRQNATLLQAIARLSAANDARGCLDGAAVKRLRQLGENRR